MQCTVANTRYDYQFAQIQKQNIEKDFTAPHEHPIDTYTHSHRDRLEYLFLSFLLHSLLVHSDTLEYELNLSIFVQKKNICVILAFSIEL